MEAEITSVNRRLFEGRNLDMNAKVVDCVRVHDDIIGLEECINRDMRAVNRKVGQIDMRMRNTESEINLGFDTVAKRIDTIGDVVEGLDRRFETYKGEQEARDNLQFDELNRSRDTRSPLRRPPFQPLGINPPPPNIIDFEGARGGDEQNNTNDLEINILTEMPGHGIQLIPICNAETATAFEEWAIRFHDFVTVYGSAWTPAEQVNRLKLYLGTDTRKILEELKPEEKNTLAEAITSIKEKLDSPHFRELAYKKLAACYQRENESVSDFIKRLKPLIKATSDHLPKDAKEETLCRNLMDKVKPEYRKSLQLVGPLIGRKDFNKLTAYIQELEVAKESESKNESPMVFAMTNPPQQTIQGKFTTWSPSSPNNRPLGPRPYQWSNGTANRARFNQGSSRGRFYDGGNRQRTNYGPQNDRKWNARPYCQLCRRTGHDQYNCRERRQNFGNRYQGRQQWNNNNRREADRQGMLFEIVENLAEQVNEIKIGNKRHASASNENVKSLQPVPKKMERETETSTVFQAAVKTEAPKKISSWERGNSNANVISPIWTALTLLLTSSFASAINPVLIPDKPMICQTQRQAMIWELPEMPLCPMISLKADQPPILQNRWIFIPNSIEFSANAWACRKIKKNARKYTSLDGVAHVEKLDPENLEISVEECKQMLQHKSCGLGQLTKRSSDLWQTEHKIDLTKRAYFFGSFNWKEVSSSNCFLFKSQIDSHFGAASIVTPLGQPTDCIYEKGQCVLSDKTVLVWKVNNYKKCAFIPFGMKKGRKMDKVWLSDDGQLGLTFAKDIVIEDCGRNISLSDQGLGSLILPLNARNSTKRRNKRQTVPLLPVSQKWRKETKKKRIQDGVVTSSQLASQLTYLDAEVTDTMRFAFSQSLRAFFEFIEDNRRWAEAAYLSNPTDLARSIFSNSYLIAKREARSFLKIWPCVPLEKSDFEFRPTKLKGECFEFLPITLKTESRQHIAFLDPTLMIVSPTSKKGPCEEFRTITIQIGNQILAIDQIEGKITSVIPKKLQNHEIKLRLSDMIPDIQSHAFHQLVLLNMTDIKDHAFVSNLVRVSQLSYQIHEEDAVLSSSVSRDWDEVKDQMISAVIGDYRKAWLIFISVIVILLAIDGAIRLGMSLLEIYAGNGRLGNLIFGYKAQKAGSKVRNMIQHTHRVVEEDYLEPIPTLKRPNWPPRVGAKSMRFSEIAHASEQNPTYECAALGEQTINFVPDLTVLVAEVKLNGKLMRCLVDTGSSASVGPMVLADHVGVKAIESESKLLSASGHPVKIKATTRVNLEIGGVSTEIAIRLFDNDLAWTMRDYHFILGCDALALLPPLTIDIPNHCLKIGKNLMALSDKNNRLTDNIKVCATQTVELNPNEQCLVKVGIQNNKPLRQQLTFYALDHRLEEEGIGFTPSLFDSQRKETFVVLTNPTETVKRIFKNTCVGKAAEVKSTDNEGIFTEVDGYEKEEELNSLGKTNVEIDPSFKIDFAKSAVRGKDLEKLKELCEEFGDIFSKSQYDLGNCTAGEHDIITTTDEPVASKPHRVPFKYRDELQKHIDQLLASVFKN